MTRVSVLAGSAGLAGSAAATRQDECLEAVQLAVEAEARNGLGSRPRTLSPWLFYDATGSELFERITRLPEYYLTRTERAIFVEHAAEILAAAAATKSNAEAHADASSDTYAGTASKGQKHRLTVLELGAGTASKTGLLLRAAVAQQGEVVYRPIDVSATALQEAQRQLEASLPGVTVVPHVADYTRAVTMAPTEDRRLVLYIGSSVGNFTPVQAASLLAKLRAQLRPGDALLLGTDLAPGAGKDAATLLAAYDDAAGVTADFNRNVLHRLNRELGANFHPNHFRHCVRWNLVESRMEMHLESVGRQRVNVPALGMELEFEPGETIHTENSYKFTAHSIATLLQGAGFAAQRTWSDERGWFAVTLASAI